MDNIEFTFAWYEELLQTLLEEGYRFDGFESRIQPETVLLRHDVDWSPRKAVRLAEIEADLGISSTYFFLVSSPFYNSVNEYVRNRVHQIQDLGHSIGLHFSTHQYFSSTPDGENGNVPNDGELINVIEREQLIMHQVSGSEICVVSFHNPPSWVCRRSFDGFTSTYEDRFFSEQVSYYADSNQRWRSNLPFAAELPAKMQVLAHPVLWGEHEGNPTDRLREERDYLSRIIDEHLAKTDRTWNGSYGFHHI
jgi:hypothetical protein